MASTCFENGICDFLTEYQDVLPTVPVENHYGDIPFVPMKIEIISLTKTADSDVPEALMIGLSSSFVVILAAIAWSQWKVFMSYIPLYLCLMPILYWALKISIAYAYAKLNYSHFRQGETTKKLKNQEEKTKIESLFDIVLGVVSRLLNDISNKRPH